MLLIQRIRNANPLVLGLLLLSLLLPLSLPAQQKPTLDQIAGLTPVNPSDLPRRGSFWLLVGPANGRPCPPLPCPPGDMPGVPIYSLGDGKFIVDDRSVDYAAKRAQAELLVSLSTMEMSLLGEGELLMSSLYSTQDLWLEITNVSSGTVSFVLHPPESEIADAVYDLFQTTNLTSSVTGLNITNWMRVLRTTPGQTNVLASTITPAESYFRLARTNDTDEDGLTDTFEALVSHSDPNSADTELSEAMWRHSLAGLLRSAVSRRRRSD
jgi:hypothetical protein